MRSSEYYTCVCRVLCQSFIQHTTLHVVNDNYTDNNLEKVDQSTQRQSFFIHNKEQVSSVDSTPRDDDDDDDDNGIFQHPIGR